MNSSNKTEAAIFPIQALFSKDLPFFIQHIYAKQKHLIQHLIHLYSSEKSRPVWWDPGTGFKRGGGLGDGLYGEGSHDGHHGRR